MKIYACAAICILAAGGWAAVRSDGEIVIEMTGDSFPQTDRVLSLWDFDATELTRRMRGKTREQVLYAVPIVSDKDRIINGKDGEYALVEYYSGGDFRKFLFKAESPQTFVTAAATAADVLAVNKKYNVNIGLSQRNFERFYQDKITAEHTDLLPKDIRLFKMEYRDINTPVPYSRWFLFEKDELTRTFETETDKNAYLNKLQKPNEENSEAKRQAHEKATARTQNQNRTVRKALISGGTTWDRANLPRVINPKPLLRRQPQPAKEK